MNLVLNNYSNIEIEEWIYIAKGYWLSAVFDGKSEDEIFLVFIV